MQNFWEKSPYIGQIAEKSQSCPRRFPAKPLHSVIDSSSIHFHISVSRPHLDIQLHQTDTVQTTPSVETSLNRNDSTTPTELLKTACEETEYGRAQLEQTATEDDRVLEGGRIINHSEIIITVRLRGHNDIPTVKTDSVPVVGSGILMTVDGPETDWYLTQTVNNHNRDTPISSI